ncbi:MAG TPA: VanW family protein [Candidatus Dorea intestinavium]|nr:VanW family protein [Candidatus Dorea intestinavium]
MSELSKRRKAYIMKERRKRRVLLFSLFCAFILIVYGMFSYQIYKFVKRYPQDIIANNVFIGSTDMSNKTKKEAEEALKANEEKAKQAKLVFELNGQQAEVTLADLDFSYQDQKAIIEKAISYGKEGNIYKRYAKLRSLKKEPAKIEEAFTFNKESLASFLTTYVDPQAEHASNATITKTASGFDIVKEKTGKKVDLNKTTELVSKKLLKDWDYQELKIKAVETVDKPTVVANDLDSVEDLLGSFSTNAGGGVRVQNIQVGVNKLNGQVLKPGETLSFLEKTVPFVPENGYVQAGAYEEGRLIDSYGGGICQVSTTLYNALLYAEIEIVERFPHSMQVDYVNPSRDAAIAEEVKDLKFKNNYDSPIYIEGFLTEDGVITFNIYGKETREAGRSVEYESEVLSTEDYQVVYKADQSAALGSMDSDGYPSEEMDAKLWKVVSQDGNEVSREPFNSSHYNRSDKIIKVGTASDNAAASSLVLSAIGSQDKATINEAINEAQGME